MPSSPRQLKKWQLALLGLTNPSPATLNFLFPHGLPYSKVARAIIKLSLDSLQRAAVQRLVKRGFVIRGRNDYSLAPAGRRYSKELLSWYVDRSPSRWDKKWRMVIFDVPEKRRQDRNYLRRLLIQNGFKKLQASVWASPFAVPREFNEQLWNMRLKYHVLYLLVSEIDYDRTLRQYFPELH
ncbi:MAG: CRISPR-associated endonuclease Cas2 [Candidatus Kerfeldbacteria bacterium]|nr:CRISPR-associated endonuclease Cas2 [Candidatus Kerfeldbacteria bacterium]